MAGGNHSNITASFAATNYLSVSAMAQHSINFAPADGTFFGISPQLVLQYYDDPNNAFTNAENPTPTPYSAIPSSYVTYSQTLDATFSYNNVGYTKTTVSISGAAPATSQFGFSLNLPVAFKFKPDSWPFGLFSGSTPTASLAWQTVTSSGQTITTTVDTYTGAAITNTVISTSPASPTSTTKLVTVFSETHSFGIFIPFQNNIRADIALNGSDVLMFDNLTMQLYVPLK